MTTETVFALTLYSIESIIHETGSCVGYSFDTGSLTALKSDKANSSPLEYVIAVSSVYELALTEVILTGVVILPPVTYQPILSVDVLTSFVFNVVVEEPDELVVTNLLLKFTHILFFGDTGVLLLL